TEKIPVVAPIPSVMHSTAAAVNPGCFASIRTACRASLAVSLTIASHHEQIFHTILPVRFLAADFAFSEISNFKSEILFRPSSLLPTHISAHHSLSDAPNQNPSPSHPQIGTIPPPRLFPKPTRPAR